MQTSTTPEQRTIGRTAAMRAAALREHAATLSHDTLEPLRAALHRRAAELELTSAVLAFGSDAAPVSLQPVPDLAATA